MLEIDEHTKAEVRRKVQSIIKKDEMRAVETEIMLHINKRLFHQGLITEEMYRLAKENFLHI